jgi:putative transposase
MLVAEAFLGSLVKLYGKHIVCSDCGRTWCPEACSSLGLRRILHSLFEKGIIERAVESVKDRTECFDDYYPCLRKSDCNLSHVYLWIILLIYVYNRSGFTFGKINQWLRNG